MISDRRRVLLLVEDRQQERFSRRLLEACGVADRDIRTLPVSHGAGSGAANVLRQYPGLVGDLRAKNFQTRLCGFVMLDADTLTVDEHHRQFDRRLIEEQHQARQPNEPIVVLVPKRNIETWIKFLQGSEVDEETDYKVRAQVDTCRAEALAMLALCRDGAPPGGRVPPSLQVACRELSRLP